MTDTTQGEAAQRDLADYPIIELHKEIEGVKRVQADFKARQGALETELAKRMEPHVTAARAAAPDKQHGTFNAAVTNTVSAKIEVKKTVDWDSAKLMAVAQTLPWERVSAIFKIEFSVSEKIYEGLQAAAPELAKQIESARTVKYGAPKVTLSVAEGAQ